MDLTVIKGLGPARRDKLEQAGIDTIKALAGSTPSELSEQVGISEGTLERLRDQATELAELLEIDGIGEATLQELAEAGIRSRKALREADAEALASSTELTADRIRGFQEGATHTAVEESALEIAEGAREAGEIARDSLGQARVVLQEGVNDAKIKFEQDVLAEARILPIKAKEDVDQRLEKLKGDVVVLREAADTAVVRLEDEVAEGLPIFKAKVSQAGENLADGVEEVRVRVQEVRDKRVLPEANKLTDKIKGLFGGS